MIPEGGAQMADDFFSEIGRSLSRFTQQAVGKTGEVVEMTKFNAQISSEQKEVEKLYQKIGELVYRGVKSGDIEVSDDLADIIGAIDSHRAVIRNARKSLAEVQKKTLCPKCHEIVAQDAAFCPRCGCAMPVPREKIESQSVSSAETVEIEEVEISETQDLPEE